MADAEGDTGAAKGEARQGLMWVCVLMWVIGLGFC